MRARRAEVLLALQTAAVALTALPLCGLTARRLGLAAGALLAAAYPLLPGTPGLQSQVTSVALEATRELTRRHQRALGACSSVRGMENSNVAPGPSFDMAERRPRWLSIIERLTERPIPIPNGFVV
jgi:hypothetical protein